MIAVHYVALGIGYLVMVLAGLVFSATLTMVAAVVAIGLWAGLSRNTEVVRRARAEIRREQEKRTMEAMRERVYRAE